VALELIVVTADLHINLPERTPFFQGAFQCPQHQPRSYLWRCQSQEYALISVGKGRPSALHRSWARAINSRAFIRRAYP